jgi:hypothetical protein
VDDAFTKNVACDGTQFIAEIEGNENYKYCSVIILIFVSAVLVHSESVCGSTERVKFDQVTIRGD